MIYKGTIREVLTKDVYFVTDSESEYDVKDRMMTMYAHYDIELSQTDDFAYNQFEMQPATEEEIEAINADKSEEMLVLL